jgi:hypothetical protein
MIVMKEKLRRCGHKMKENPWIIATSILAIIVLVLLFGNLVTGNSISKEDAGQKLLALYSSQGVEGLTLDSVEEISGLYRVNFLYQGQTVPIYLTKDGEFAGSLNALPTENTQETETETPSQEITKSDKPKVELFVMTYCPYGTQAEKGLIPVIEALGNSIDAKIRFVHYFMHGEKESNETDTQICIREEQNDKFLVYLREFLVEGNSANALTKAKIDTVKLNDCIKNRAAGYYAEDSQLSEGYGVQGSPTLVINGEIVSSDGKNYAFNKEKIPFSRSPNTYKQIVCSLFNSSPESCNAELSTKGPAAMWGWDESSASASTGSC